MLSSGSILVEVWSDSVSKNRGSIPYKLKMTMANIFKTVDYYRTRASKIDAILFGVFLSFVTCIIPDLLFGEAFGTVGVLLIVPFIFRLLKLSHLVTISRYEREKYLGKGYSGWFAHLALIFTKYGLFCFFWMNTMVLYMAFAYGGSLKWEPVLLYDLWVHLQQGNQHLATADW